MKKTNDNSISLNKYISSTGMCSRREADKLIIQNRVSINDITAQPGNRVFEQDVVYVDGEALDARPKTIYIAFNKPVGIICTTDLKEPNNIISYINHPKRLFPIGRLDKLSQGLIFLTNDGDIVNKILRAGNQHEKEYVVTVKQAITPDFIRKMSQGVKILGTITKPCKVNSISKYTFKIVLTQGLNRQIRRMCECLGYEVSKLNRTRIMNVKLDGIKSGEWSELTPLEIEQINKLLAKSSKTEEASRDKRTKKNFHKIKSVPPTKGSKKRKEDKKRPRR